MEYSKRIIILVSPDGDVATKGILSCEQTGTNLRCILKTFNIKTSRTAVLGISLDGTLLSPVNVPSAAIGKFEFNLNNSLKICSDITVMLAEKENNKLEPLLFGGAPCGKTEVENFLNNLANFGKHVIESPARDAAQLSTASQTGSVSALPPKFTAAPANNYEFKAVPTSQEETNVDFNNYIEPESNYKEADIEVLIDNHMQKEFGSTHFDPALNAEPAKEQEEQPPFFMLVEDQIEKAFLTYPKNSELEVLIENSRWVNVDYDGSGMFYCLGVIYGERSESHSKDYKEPQADSTVKYICYAVPAHGSQKPPQDLSPYCQWLPVHEGDISGTGYYIMFQNAKTGESVNLAM